MTRPVPSMCSAAGSICPVPAAVKCAKSMNHGNKDAALVLCAVDALPNSIRKWRSRSMCMIPQEESADPRS